MVFILESGLSNWQGLEPQSACSSSRYTNHSADVPNSCKQNMSFIYNYLYYKDEKKDDDEYVKVGYISINDLKSINLKPTIKDDKSYDDLKKSIINIKLKPIPKTIEKNNYQPRHPCLRELLTKFEKK